MSNMGIWVHRWKERPIIMLGLKGILYVELIAKGGPSRDVHLVLQHCMKNLLGSYKCPKDSSWYQWKNFNKKLV